MNPINEEFNGWTNRETWAFFMISNQDPNRRNWLKWRSKELLEEIPNASSLYVGEKLVEETKRWARQFYKRNETATFLVDEVGSWWRVDEDEVGTMVLDEVDR